MSRGIEKLLAAGACGAALVALAGCGIKPSAHADVVGGKKLFVSKCGSCHTLSRAGTKGIVGPNLDEAFRASLNDGLGRHTIDGVVRQQILFPAIGGAMPANLVDSKQAGDIAAYVAYAAARPGSDGGLLALAVPQAGGGGTAVAKGGTLSLEADPNGQLLFTDSKATAPAGRLSVSLANTSGTPHNVAIQSGTSGPVLGATPIQSKGTASVSVTLKPGTYTFFCQVPGHRAAGMLGTLTVK